MTTLRAIAALTLAVCFVVLAMRLEPLEPEEAQELWREAFDDAFQTFGTPRR